ncbi:MAG: UDP-N-acetylmuramoyl-L-alanyl-D-glutamate--2,6-diaminopimelate ligase, partial [Desulfamplus sp.]|nr:UDP-N-acetylmuramoyl-L-alanyl-D-glutamate--2,6-diaminopimelate ligase [Desulfamplus sp.]
MKLSYLIKDCTPVWSRMIQPAINSHSHDHHHHYYTDANYSDTDSDEKTVSYHSDQSSDPEISSIHANASQVKSGGLFIAIKGFKADGHDYIAQAVANGAAAIITEKKIGKKEIVDSGIYADRNISNRDQNNSAKSMLKPVIVEVKDSRKAMSSIAARFYGNPSDSMTLIGVTGTNGKTTTAFLIESIFKSAGYNTGVIGTVNYRFANQTFENPVTTPESIDLHRILAQMRDAGVTHVVMEVSSHAVDLHRVRDCEFDVGVFTNLTQDHLDYHKTMSAYFACKKSFFTRQLKRGKKGESSVSVINIDDSYGEKIAYELDSRVVTTSILTPKEKRNNLNIFSSNITDDISGLQGYIHIQKAISSMQTDSADIKIKFSSKLTGQFNLENILCATGAANAIGISPEIIGKGIEECYGVPGRLERVENEVIGDGFERHVFVDYAHTPDALESILKTLKMRAPARLITIFGCGGDRDRSKRPIMGEIASRYSNITIITSDNPRTENPDAIIAQIVKGIKDKDTKLPDDKNGNKEVIIEPDRAKALELAVTISQPNDIIVAAGKGHETYQITAQGKIDFDDRVILKKALTTETMPKFVPIAWNCADIVEALGISNPIIPITQVTQINPVATLNPNQELSSDRFASVSTDSRTIKKDELFVALKGERFDGHNFIFDLMRQGVRGFVVEKGFYDNLTPEQKSECNRNDIYFFEVYDCLEALGMLARFQRIRSGVKVVAITGSNGKTTTRRMTASIFEQNFKTLSTQGNLNNEIGVPLTLLKLSKDHEWAVIEMGMNHPGEISRLSKITCPDIAIITNTTDAHLEGLGSVEDVARAKSEITEGMNPNSTIIINRDDPRWEIIADKAEKIPNISGKIFFGLDGVFDAFDSDIKNKKFLEKGYFSANDIVFNQDAITFSLCV